jgi:hypothetical protein
MNNSGTVVSASDLASRVLATASVAQSRCRVQSGEANVCGKVSSWTKQIHNSTRSISVSHNAFIVPDGSSLPESHYQPPFQMDDSGRVVALGSRPRRVRS